jgi:hypothetical protein
MRGVRRWVTCVLAVAACRDLPAIEHGVCGNGVVEAGEDCDGATATGLACAAPNEAEACRYTCATASCPPGWACGDDGVCRYGTGELVADPAIAFSHDELAIADFDGDRRGDLVSFGTRGAHVLFDDRTTIVASPDPLTGTSVVGDLDGDGLADLIAPMALGLAIARGEVDRTVTPASYAPFLAPADSWFVPVRVPLAGEGDAVAAFVPAPPASPTDPPQQTNIALYLVPSGELQHTTTLATDVPVSSLGSLALRADLDAPSQEDELVVAAPGHPQLWVVKPTQTLAGFIAMVPTAKNLGTTSTVSDGRLLLADVDGDGDLDVLAGALTLAGAHVALLKNENGQLQDGVAYAALDFLPLAIADLDGDGDLDAVSADAVLLRDSVLTAVYRRSTDAPWREAVITDVDRDLRPDVIVSAGGGGLDVLRNRPAGFVRVAIDTAGPVARLRAGDFDGDGLGDVAFRERADRDRVRVLFGAIGAFAPAVAAIGLPAIHRLELGRFRDDRNVDDVVDDFVLGGYDGTKAGISFATGSGDRRIRSTLFLTRGSRSDSPLGVVRGRFVTDSGRDLVVLATDRQGQARLWVFGGAEQLAYRVDHAHIVAPLGALALLQDPKLVAADTDGDGRDELVALGRDAGGVAQLVIVTLRGLAAPDVRVVDPGVVGVPRDVVAADLDRDGRSELLIAGDAGLVRYAGGTLTVIASSAATVCVAQLDADPALEIAAIADHTLSILDGTTLTVQRSFPTTATFVRAGEIDGDGVDDLVLGDGFSVTRMHSVTQVPR